MRVVGGCIMLIHLHRHLHGVDVAAWMSACPCRACRDCCALGDDREKQRSAKKSCDEGAGHDGFFS